MHVRKLQFKGPVPVFVYEAGLCGYWCYRYQKKGHPAEWSRRRASSQKAGDRAKTDLRDAAQPMRSDLISVYVPEVVDEASRDLSRARR